jgi:molybdopterin converting factor small subunit
MKTSQLQGSEQPPDGRTVGVVQVELTGPLRRSAGADHVAVPSGASLTLAELIEQLRQLYPATAPHLTVAVDGSGLCSGLPAGLLVLRNHQLLPSDPGFVVEAGDHLTLMPMISGG